MSSSPPNKHTLDSLPPWPLMDFNTPLSCLLQEEIQHPSSFMRLKSASPSPPWNPPPLLSSPASMGASTAKVTKRKSRAVHKPPIRVLSADRSTFRDMVQRLTGIPTSPSMQATHLWTVANSSGISRPLATRPGAHRELMATAHQSMPTLDTSSPYLSRGVSSSNLVYNEGEKSRFNSLYEANLNPSVQPALNFDLSGGARNFDWSGGVMYEAGAYNEGGMDMAMDMESSRRLRRASELESLLMGSNKLEDVLHSNHWLSPDLMRSPSPKVEAHSV